ncbi:MAG TPA: tail tape measure protein [Sphingomonas sp.]|jgi:hypothetical protein
MDEDDELVVGVRADTTAFRREVSEMRQLLEGSLGAGGDRAGRAIEGSLLRAVRQGRLGFEDLRQVALSAMADIAAASIKAGLGAILGGRSGGGGGGGPAIGSLLMGLLGVPGRATGGPVAPARPYLVGERGPELFVPTAAGRIEAMSPGGGARDVRVSITVRAGAGEAPAALRASGRQVARAVRAALGE